jgi:hypothetical protein
VRSILKALGTTIWGLVVIAMLAICMAVGFQVVIKYRASRNDLANHGDLGGQRGLEAPVAAGGPIGSVPGRTRSPPVDAANSRTPAATRELMSKADGEHNPKLAIAYGQQLIHENSAEPRDLSTVAQSYSSVGDCASARAYAQRAHDAYQLAGLAPDGVLRSVISCCGPGRENYELAITSIERGLRKGGVAHLDEAYVYLGLAKQAVGDFEGARTAFAKLKDVPGISPRVLRLWSLYAETQLGKTGSSACRIARQADHEAGSATTTEMPGSGRE